MPCWDYHCENCGAVQALWFTNWERAQEAAPHCTLCNHAMTRVTSVGSFVIKGYSAKNGYAKGPHA